MLCPDAVYQNRILFFYYTASNSNMPLIMVKINVNRDSRVNVISLLSICMKHEIKKLQLFQFFRIFPDFEWNICKFCAISCEIAENTKMGFEWEFSTWNWSEQRFHEMLKITCKHEFSMNMNFNYWIFLAYIHKIPC